MQKTRDKEKSPPRNKMSFHLDGSLNTFLKKFKRNKGVSLNEQINSAVRWYIGSGFTCSKEFDPKDKRQHNNYHVDADVWALIQGMSEEEKGKFSNYNQFLNSAIYCYVEQDRP